MNNLSRFLSKLVKELDMQSNQFSFLRSAEILWFARWTSRGFAFATALGFATTLAWSADNSAQVAEALSYKPRQADVDYDQVSESDIPKCTGAIERRGTISGLVIRDPSGQVIRWFADVNGDKRVDQWSYYLNGTEVYREIDSDFNQKADQYRWFGPAGLRWGVDSDEDGSIDSWKLLSAEELTYEVVEALRNRDINRFQRLLLTPEELDSLGLGEEKRTQLAERIKNSLGDFQDFLSKQKVINDRTRWEHFGADRPGIIPADTDGSTRDVTFYENVVAVIGDGSKDQQLIVGNLILVDNVWKLMDAPKLAANGVVEGGFFTAALHRPRESTDGTGLSATVQKLLDELQNVETKLQSPNANRASLNSDRADVLEKLIAASDTEEDVRTWVHQFADTVSAAIQSGEFPAGLKRLNEIASILNRAEKTRPYVSYVVFRAIGSKYFEAISQPNANYQSAEEEYLQSLQRFVETYPNTEDAADAMIRIGLSNEMSGDIKQAEEWYSKAASKFPDSSIGKKAKGAVTRLNLTGRTLKFKGKTIEGKAFESASPEYAKRPLVIQFWASWCEPCKADMKDLRQLQIDFAKEKLAVVGVNLDKDVTSAKRFLAAEKNLAPWPHVYEEGGMESDLATSLGILSLPVTIVLDTEGKVIYSGSHFSRELSSIIRDSLPTQKK